MTDIEFLESQLDALNEVREWAIGQQSLDKETWRATLRAVLRLHGVTNEWTKKRLTRIYQGCMAAQDGDILQFLEDPSNIDLTVLTPKECCKTLAQAIARMEAAKEFMSHLGSDTEQPVIDCDPNLTDREFTVLTVLAGNEGRYLDQQTIAAQAELGKSRNSVRPHLNRLREKGLVSCPNNSPRKGYAITAKGTRSYEKHLER